MKGRIIGLSNILKNLEQFPNEVTRKGLRGVVRATTIAGLKASELTPIGDTSNLINSQRKEYMLDGAKIRGFVSYDTDYAIKVNSPKYKMNFRRAGAEKRFLQKGFERTKNEMESAIIDEMKI